MDKHQTMELAIKQHIANCAKVEILNYKCDYVGIQYSNTNGYYMLAGNIHMTYNGGSTGKSIKDFRLCLRPLSDLTKEIEHKGHTIIPIDYISTSTQDGQRTMRRVANEQEMDVLDYWKVQRLFEMHFDVFGLIPAGLAVDINTLKGGTSCK